MLSAPYYFTKPLYTAEPSTSALIVKYEGILNHFTLCFKSTSLSFNGVFLLGVIGTKLTTEKRGARGGFCKLSI